MRNLGMIKQIPLEIASLLAANEHIQRLLILDSSSLNEDFEVLDINQLLKDEYISIVPKLENGLIAINRNSYIIINLESFLFDANNANINVEGIILIGTNKSHVLLDNNKNRLLELLDEVYQSLNGYKLSTSGQLNIDQANAIAISENSFGYKINFSINEQQTEGAEI